MQPWRWRLFLQRLGLAGQDDFAEHALCFELTLDRLQIFVDGNLEFDTPLAGGYKGGKLCLCSCSQGSAHRAGFAFEEIDTTATNPATAALGMEPATADQAATAGPGAGAAAPGAMMAAASRAITAGAGMPMGPTTTSSEATTKEASTQETTLEGATVASQAESSAAAASPAASATAVSPTGVPAAG